MNISFYLEQMSQDKLLFIALPIFLSAILAEFYFAKKEQLDWYTEKDTKASFWMMIITALVELLPKLLAFAAFYYLHEISPLKDIIQRQWWAWILLFVLDDFSYYWFHRSNHEVRLFWAGHVPHHSAIKMNFSTALRQGVGERLHKFFFWLWLPLLGFDALMIFTMMAINLIYQFWTHTELVGKLPRWVEFVFNTPSHHRVHHASNFRYLDRNHGGALIIWDRLFGTFSEEKEGEKPVYGLTENITSHHPIHVATHEYQAIWQDVKRANKWSDKLKYIFYAPGWSHDGEDLRARVLRKEI
ncbi:MAG: sterol desaturase/sphingolipid hydroxylase (fatty acid hydroxylase superfamily) [Paraglaciecola sp.]|jgi:sterol desaturase/sphingolipid hydroxylase (fatty acid hydroxylase superfamily)